MGHLELRLLTIIGFTLVHILKICYWLEKTLNPGIFRKKLVFMILDDVTTVQVVSLSQDGSMTVWMIDTGQKVKTLPQIHGEAEVTCMSQDTSETRIYTGSTDGTVKVLSIYEK